MKIIFSKDFKNKLNQSDKKIRLDKYFIKTLNSSNDVLSDSSLFSIPGDNEIRNLHSIWDNKLKLLFLSLSINSDDINSLLEKDSVAYVSIMYSSIQGNNTVDEEGIAFLLLGDNSSTDGEKYLPSKLNFSTIMNLVNIDFSNIPITAEIETVLTDSTKILEDSIDIGNNIYLLKPEDIVTITVDSFRKKLYRDRCNDLKTDTKSDFLKSDTGERVYRNMILRVYNPKAFYPKLVGDVVIITSEGEKVIRTTTTTTTELPETTTTTTIGPVTPIKKQVSAVNITENEPNTIEYNSLGLNYLGGEIKIVGLVGYHDYLIQNNKVIEFSSGYQNISEISNLVVDISKLFDKDGKNYPEIKTLDCNKKTITYGKSGSPEITYGNKLTLYLPTIILNTGDTSDIINVDLHSCKKEFKLKQSNDFNIPWSLQMPENIEIGYEFESVEKGLSLYPVPVIIFNSEGKTEDNTNNCNIKLVSNDELILDSISSGKFKLLYEYADGYSTSIDSAENEFNRFFEIGEPEVTRGGYLFNIKCKDFFGPVPPESWLPVSENQEQLLIKVKISISLIKGEFLNGSDTFETPFYVVRKPTYIKTIGVYKDDNFNDPKEEHYKVSSIYLKHNSTESLYESELLKVVSRKIGLPDTTSKSINRWILNNPNLFPNLFCNQINENASISENIDYGTLTLDTYFGYYEYSSKLIFKSIGEDNFDLENITFNYLDEDIFGKEGVLDLINNFDINDWKSSILMPKVSLPVVKESELKAEYKELSFNKETLQCSEEVRVVTGIDQYAIDDSYSLVTGRLGDHEIKIKSDRNFSVTFTHSDFINKDSVSLIGEGNYNSSSEDVIITLRIYNVDLSSLSDNTVLGIITIKQSENSFIKLKVTTLLAEPRYLENLHLFNLSQEYYMSPIDPIISNIFLSGYKYIDGVVSEVSRDDVLKIKYSSPITTITTGTVVTGATIIVGGDQEDGNDCLILGTTYNEEKGWSWYKNYITEFGLGSQGFHIPEDKEKPEEVIIGSTLYDPIEKCLLTMTPCSSRLWGSNENKFYKYPVPKLGEIRTHILGTKDYNLTDNSGDDLINYSIYKRGLRPELFNTYDHSELKSTDIFVVDSEAEEVGGFYKETIYYTVESLYPLTTSEVTTLSLGTDKGIDVDLDEDFTIESFHSIINIDPLDTKEEKDYFGFGTKTASGYTSGWEINEVTETRAYKNKLSAINYIPVDINRDSSKIIEDTDKYPIGSLILSHYIPNTKIINITDNLITVDSDTSLENYNTITVTSSTNVTSDIKTIVKDNRGNSFEITILAGSDTATIKLPKDMRIGPIFYIKEITPYLDKNYNYYSKDYYKYVEDPFEAILNVHWVGKKWAEISMDTSVIGILGGTKQLTLNKPHIYSAEISSELDSEYVSVNWNIDEEKTKNNSTIDFTININKHEEAVNLLENTSEPINLTDPDEFWLNYSQINDISTELEFTINNDYKVSKSIIQRKFNNSIFYRDIDSDIYNLFIKGDIYGIETGNIKKEVSYSTTSISLTLLGVQIENLLNFDKTSYSISGELIKIENLNDINSDVKITISNITELDQNSKDNILIEFNDNKKNIKREIPLKISYNEINFLYTIIQDAYNPEITINGNPISVYSIGDVIEDSNRVLGFHSSGNYLNNTEFEGSEFGYITLEVNKNIDIYDEITGLLRLSMLENNSHVNLEHYIVDISSGNNGSILYKVFIKISPNYTRKPVTGSIVLRDFSNDNTWYIGFIQGYITATLSPNYDFELDYNISWDNESSKYIGIVGTEDTPISYPANEVITDPYFYVKIIQREIFYTNNIPYIGSEYLISTNYSSIDKIPRSISLENKYTTVTYQVDPWTSTIENGINRVFSSYSTDLYYYPGEADYFPRLIHKYKVSSGYGDDELIFNIQTKLAISRYKKYLYITDDTDNLDSEILHLNTTPFLFSFWLRKVENKNTLPIYLYDPENNSPISGAIVFNGESFETKKVLVKFTDSDLNLLNDVDIVSSDKWISFSVDYVENILSITCRGNTTGEVRNGVITLMPKDTIRWSGIKSLDIRQLVPETTLVEAIPKVTLVNSDPLLLLIQYNSVPLIIDSFGFEFTNKEGSSDNWIVEFNPGDEYYNYSGDISTIPDDFKTFDFENGRWRWLFKIIPNMSTSPISANLTLKIDYRVGEIDGELKHWSEQLEIIQWEKPENEEVETTTTTTTTTSTKIPSDDTCDIICDV